PPTESCILSLHDALPISSAVLADRTESISRDNEVLPRDKAEKDKSNSARLGLTLAELTAKTIEDNHLNGVSSASVRPSRALLLLDRKSTRLNSSHVAISY